MKALAGRLLSLLNEHNQTEPVMRDGGVQLVENFSFFISPVEKKVPYLKLNLEV